MPDRGAPPAGAPVRPGSSVLVLAPNWLGDAVMSLPAVTDVRRRYPSSHLVVAARASVAEIFRFVPSIDEVVTLEWRGRLFPRRPRVRDVDRLRAIAPRIAILLPNSFAAAWLVRRAGIPERWGYARDMRRLLLTRAIRPPDRSMHQGAYYQQLTRELGMENGPLEPCVRVPSTLVDEARALLEEGGWEASRPLIALAPGAAYGTAKQWPPGHFAQAIGGIASALDAQYVLLGSRADAQAAARVREMVADGIRPRVIDLTGRTSLGMLVAVLTLASACVANDSGALHLAAAAGAPVAALFGPTREYESAPLPHAGVPAEILINPVSCRPCMLRECPIDHRCMRGLDPARATAAVLRMVSDRGGAASGGDASR